MSTRRHIGFLTYLLAFFTLVGCDGVESRHDSAHAPGDLPVTVSGDDSAHAPDDLPATASGAGADLPLPSGNMSQVSMRLSSFMECYRAETEILMETEIQDVRVHDADLVAFRDSMRGEYGIERVFGIVDLLEEDRQRGRDLGKDHKTRGMFVIGIREVLGVRKVVFMSSNIFRNGVSNMTDTMPWDFTELAAMLERADYTGACGW